jgi:hypothetical protein
MKTYQFESVIPDNGWIALPVALKNLRHHRVKCILIDLDEPHQNALDRLETLTRQYTELTEADIDLGRVQTKGLHQ